MICEGPWDFLYWVETVVLLCILQGQICLVILVLHTRCVASPSMLLPPSECYWLANTGPLNYGRWLDQNSAPIVNHLWIKERQIKFACAGVSVVCNSFLLLCLTLVSLDGGLHSVTAFCCLILLFFPTDICCLRGMWTNVVELLCVTLWLVLCVITNNNLRKLELSNWRVSAWRIWCWLKHFNPVTENYFLKACFPRPGEEMATLPFLTLLTVRRTRLSTVGDRAIPVAAARTWNSLPQHVTSAPSMSVFRGCLKAFLFRRSFPWTRYHNFCSTCTVTVVIFRHFNHSFYLLTYLPQHICQHKTLLLCLRQLWREFRALHYTNCFANKFLG